MLYCQKPWLYSLVSESCGTWSPLWPYVQKWMWTALSLLCNFSFPCFLVFCTRSIYHPNLPFFFSQWNSSIMRSVELVVPAVEGVRLSINTNTPFKMKTEVALLCAHAQTPQWSNMAGNNTTDRTYFRWPKMHFEESGEFNYCK